MKKIFGIFILSIIFVSCGGNKDNRPLQEYVSAFLKENKTIVAFGKVNVNSILTKSEYSKIPKIGFIVEKELESYKQLINTETPVYFALEGPFSEDGTPATTYAFVEVVNADSLVSRLTQQGFEMEKSGDVNYFQSGDVSVGVRNNLAILISKGTEFDGEKLLSKAFEKVTDDVSEGKIDQILSAEGDLVLGSNIENLYSTSNTDLADLSEDKKKKINDMVVDSYIQTALSFDKGAVVIESKNYFSESLKSKMFFKKDASASVVSHLGTGNPKMGFAMNLDMKKLQGFINEYSPNTMKELGEAMGGPAAFVIASGGDNALSNLFTGEMAAVMVGEPNAMEGLSEFNFFLGLGNQGKTFANGMKDMLEVSMAKVELTGNGLSVYSNANNIPQPGKKLMIPKGCEVFGKKGITAFLYLEGVDLSTFEFEDEQKIIYLIKYVTFEMDENGSKIVIKAKDGKENMLKQSVDFIVKEFTGKMSEMNALTD